MENGQSQNQGANQGTPDESPIRVLQSSAVNTNSPQQQFIRPLDLINFGQNPNLNDSGFSSPFLSPSAFQFTSQSFLYPPSVNVTPYIARPSSRSSQISGTSGYASETPSPAVSVSLSPFPFPQPLQARRPASRSLRRCTSALPAQSQHWGQPQDLPPTNLFPTTGEGNLSVQQCEEQIKELKKKIKVLEEKAEETSNLQADNAKLQYDYSILKMNSTGDRRQIELLERELSSLRLEKSNMIDHINQQYATIQNILDDASKKREKINKLEKSIKRANFSHSNLKREVDCLKLENEKLKKSCTDKETEVSQLKKSLESLGQKYDKLSDEYTIYKESHHENWRQCFEVQKSSNQHLLDSNKLYQEEMKKKDAEIKVQFDEIKAKMEAITVKDAEILSKDMKIKQLQNDKLMLEVDADKVAAEMNELLSKLEERKSHSMKQDDLIERMLHQKGKEEGCKDGCAVKRQAQWETEASMIKRSRHVMELSPMLAIDIKMVDEQSEYYKHLNKMYEKGKIFPMQSDNRGFCLIINNQNFPESTLDPRSGSDMDMINLSQLFTHLQYTPKTSRDLTRQDILDLVESESTNPVHESADAFVLGVLSHGTCGAVYGSDGKLVTVQELMEPFNGVRCKALRGKPKLIIIVACQGGQETNGLVVDDGGGDGCSLKVHEMADFIIIHSTVPGFKSFRDTNKGTWFVRCLVKVFMENAHIKNVTAMLHQVVGEVSQLSHQVYNQIQQPEFKSSLSREWHMLPGCTIPSPALPPNANAQ